MIEIYDFQGSSKTIRPCDIGCVKYVARTLAEGFPMDEFSNLVRHMNQMVSREMGRQLHGFSPTDAFRPSINLYETQVAFLICVDLAGMDQRDIEVTLEKGSVLIRGRRTSPMPPDGSKAVAVHLMEIDHGTFCRSVELPAGVDDVAIAANYHLGMLWVTLPKKS